MVTHTVPHPTLLSHNYPSEKTKYAGCYGNSLFKEFFNEDSITHFIFGHNHDAKLCIPIYNKLFINNARGKPDDYNRVNYKPYTVELY